ncbi:MAG: nucleotidyltransferase domain-containing protein [Archangium sp.]
MTPSVDSMRLRALALEVLKSVSKKGDCIAITGSVARGNATRDSELDLWILGSRSGRFTKNVHGTNVQLLCQRPEEAVAFDNLCLFEVDDLLLLDDRAGAFEALRRVWKKQRRRVRAEVIRGTQKQTELELARGQQGSEWHRATFLRLAAWRLLCLRVFIDHGWRVPRLHALRASLPKPLSKRLDEVLALPKPANARAAVKLMKGVEREARQHVDLGDYALPHALDAKVKTAPDEAAFLARQELVSDLLPAVFNTWGITDVRGVELLGRVAPNTAKAFQLLEPRPKKGDVKKLQAHVAAIQRAL